MTFFHMILWLVVVPVALIVVGMIWLLLGNKLLCCLLGC